MRAFSVAFLATVFALPAAAQEFTESVADVNFEVEQTLYRGSDLAARFPQTGSFFVEAAVDIDADLEGEMAGVSSLMWPESMTQSWEGVAGGGALDVDLMMNFDLSIVFDGVVDLGFAGEYDFTGANRFAYPVLGDQWEWFKSGLFDSVLLPGAATPSTVILFDGENDATLALWNLDLGELVFEIPFVGYYAEIGGDLEIRPQTSFTLTGQRISTRGRDITVHDGTVIVPAPNTNDGTAQYESMWHGIASSDFGLTGGLYPTIFLGSQLNPDGSLIAETTGTVGTAAGILRSLITQQTTFTFQLAQDERVIQSKNTDYTHDLPAIDVNQSRLDFGTVEVGADSQLNLVIEDLGALDLWGDISVEGEGFSISRPDLEIDGDGDMTLTVTFNPGAVGDFDGTVVFDSNDPVTPSMAIPLSGTGFQEGVDPVDTGDIDGPDGEAGIRGCGCSSAPTGGLAWLALVPVLGFVVRRRR